MVMQIEVGASGPDMPSTIHQVPMTVAAPSRPFISKGSMMIHKDRALVIATGCTGIRLLQLGSLLILWQCRKEVL